MPRKRRRRPNWPYRLAWLGIWLALLVYVGIQTLTHALTMGRRSYGIDWQLSLVASLFDATVAVFFFVVGACIGSFLNVVAYRLPLGRYIGGHSACPYCQTPIDGADNVPFLAWIKLRGRCRACRLPISIQYPLIELSVAVVFLIVYLTEFATGGTNLPSMESLASRGGMLRVAVTPKIILQIFVYLFLLSSLIAAALIAIKRRRAPLSLYAWGGLPLFCGAMLMPSMLVLPWRAAAELSPFEARMDAFVTLLCGAAVGMAIARLLAPLAYRGFDRSLLSADAKSSGARQFVGAMAVAGASVGWQSGVLLAWCVVLCALAGAISIQLLFRGRPGVPSHSSKIEPSDLTVWVWFGLLIFRANWAQLLCLQLLPDLVPEVARQVLGALLLAPAAWYLGQLFDQPKPTIHHAAEIDSELDERLE